MINILKNGLNNDNLHLVTKNNLWDKKIRDMRGVESKYYIRICVLDESGVLGDITAIFGEYDVSLGSVIQRGENRDPNEVDLVLVTHNCRESQIINAIDDIYELKTVKKIENIIRIEDFN